MSLIPDICWKFTETIDGLSSFELVSLQSSYRRMVDGGWLLQRKCIISCILSILWDCWFGGFFHGYNNAAAPLQGALVVDVTRQSFGGQLNPLQPLPP